MILLSDKKQKYISLMFIVFFCLFSFSSIAFEGGQLPPCSGSETDVSTWDNCEGVYHLSDGSIYAGEFRKGKKNGNGIITYSDGSIYTGTFSEEKMEGIGILLFVSGDKYAGEFHENEMTGKGVLYQSGSQIIMGEFYHGALVRIAELKENEVFNKESYEQLADKSKTVSEPKLKILWPESINVVFLIGFIGFCVVILLYPPFDGDISEEIKRRHRCDWLGMICVLVFGSALVFPKVQDIYQPISEIYGILFSEKNQNISTAVQDKSFGHR